MPENAALGVPLYAALARDRDSGKNGEVSYRLGPSAAPAAPFAVHPRTGHLTLTRHLDFEAAPRHSLLLTATDGGEPPLSANLTVLVEVQDVNDNAPVFERPSYSVSLPESQSVNVQVSRHSAALLVGPQELVD